MSTATEETKQITFEGVTYTVPTWVKWVAKDSNLEIWGYNNLPRLEKGEWVVDMFVSKVCLVHGGCDDWEDSLTEV